MIKDTLMTFTHRRTDQWDPLLPVELLYHSCNISVIIRCNWKYIASNCNIRPPLMFNWVRFVEVNSKCSYFTVCKLVEKLLIACLIWATVFFKQFRGTSLPPFLFSHMPLFQPREQQNISSATQSRGLRWGEGGVQAFTLYRCPLQKVMVWDNYPSTSTCLLKMADSAVVGLQYETVVIKIWISFHSHSGSHPDNTWLTKSTRWNWPVSSISRAICATQPWITAMGKTYCHTAGWEEPKIPCRAPRIGTARRNESTITHFH